MKIFFVMWQRCRLESRGWSGGIGNSILYFPIWTTLILFATSV